MRCPLALRRHRCPSLKGARERVHRTESEERTLDGIQRKQALRVTAGLAVGLQCRRWKAAGRASPLACSQQVRGRCVSRLYDSSGIGDYEDR